MKSVLSRIAVLKDRWNALLLKRALKKRPDAGIGGVSHKVPPEHHNRGTGG